MSEYVSQTVKVETVPAPDGNGSWRRLEFTRRPAMNIWLMPEARTALMPQPNARRLLVMVHPSAYFPEGEWLRALGGFDHFVECCGAGDVVWVPLYLCGVNRRVAWPEILGQKLPDYDRHLDLIKALAPRVKAVLIGNMGPELCGWSPNWPRSAMLLEFAKHHAELVHNAGGTPAFGTVDWDIIMDCYLQGGLLHDGMKALGALQVCFCGFTLSARCYLDEANKLHWGQRKAINEAEHGEPWMRMNQYIRSSEIISGIGGLRGFDELNDIHLRTLGFKGGVMGVPG